VQVRIYLYGRKYVYVYMGASTYMCIWVQVRICVYVNRNGVYE